MKLILPLALVLVGIIALPHSTSAQRYDPRIDVPRVVAQPTIPDHGPESDKQLPRELDQLNRDVRGVRQQIRAAGSRGRRVRSQFDRIVRATDQLNAAFRRGALNRREMRSRAEGIGLELGAVQKQLQLR